MPAAACRSAGIATTIAQLQLAGSAPDVQSRLPSSPRPASCAPGSTSATSCWSAAAAPTGEPEGVAPDMARAVAERLGVPVNYVTFPRPGELADAAGKGVWDIGLIAAEPARAETIAFSPAYVRDRGDLPGARTARRSPASSEVDRPGVRIAIAERSAYDLWLSRHLRHAELVRAPSLDASFDLFVARPARRARRPQAAPAAGRREAARRPDPRRPLHRGAAVDRHGARQSRPAPPSCATSSRRRKPRAWSRA